MQSSFVFICIKERVAYAKLGKSAENREEEVGLHAIMHYPK